jgi:hypothetical protein
MHARIDQLFLPELCFLIRSPCVPLFTVPPPPVTERLENGRAPRWIANEGFTMRMPPTSADIRDPKNWIYHRAEKGQSPTCWHTSLYEIVGDECLDPVSGLSCTESGALTPSRNNVCCKNVDSMHLTLIMYHQVHVNTKIYLEISHGVCVHTHAHTHTHYIQVYVYTIYIPSDFNHCSLLIYIYLCAVHIPSSSHGNIYIYLYAVYIPSDFPWQS